MKPFLHLVLLTPAICCAQGQAPAQAAAPVITFQKTHCDLGKIPPDRKAVCHFKVTNTGKAYLNITRLSPSCGCTSTMAGKWSLAPGESTEVEATFNPAGYRGTVRKSLQVISDDPVNPTVTLTFEAEVIQDIMPETTSLFLQDIVKTAPKRTTVRLKSGNGQPVRVKETKSPGAPYLSATVRGEGNDALVDIQFDGRKVPQGKLSGIDAISVVTTNERMPIIGINVQWEFKPFITATPERVAWVEPAGKDLQETVHLKQVDGRAFKILNAVPSSSMVRVEGLSRGSSAQQEFKVVLAAGAKPGTYNENVVLTLDDPDQPELTIRVSAVLR